MQGKKKQRRPIISGVSEVLYYALTISTPREVLLKAQFLNAGENGAIRYFQHGKPKLVEQDIIPRLGFPSNNHIVASDKGSMPGLLLVPVGGSPNWALLLRALVRFQDVPLAGGSRPPSATAPAADTVELRWLQAAVRAGGEVAGDSPAPATGPGQPATAAPAYAEAAYQSLGDTWLGEPLSVGKEETAVRGMMHDVVTGPSGAKPPANSRSETGNAVRFHTTYAPEPARRWLALTKHQRERKMRLRTERGSRTCLVRPGFYPVRRALRAVGAVWRRWPLLALFGLWFCFGLAAGIVAPSFLPIWGIGLLGLVTAGVVASSFRIFR